MTRLSADVIEDATQQDLAIWLHRDRIDPIVRVRVERIRQACGSIEASDTIARLPTDATELAACQDFAVRRRYD